MPIYASAKDGSTFTPAPEGVHQAIAVDVIDLGMKDNQFKPGTKQHKIDIAWELAETRDDGKRFLAYKRYTLSISEKATLRKDLESWRGRPFTRDEEMQFDVESILGANCLLNIQHSARDGKTYANVIAVMPLIKGMPKIVTSGDYKRVCDRTPEDAQSDAHEPPPPDDASATADITEDDIPFAWLLPFVLPVIGSLSMVA